MQKKKAFYFFGWCACKNAKVKAVNKITIKKIFELFNLSFCSHGSVHDRYLSVN